MTAVLPARPSPQEDQSMSTSQPVNTGTGCACGKPVGDHAYLCGECTRRLADDLRLLGPAATEVPVNACWQRDYELGGVQLRGTDGKLIPVAFGRGATTRWDTPVGSAAGLVDHLELAFSRQARIGDKAPRGSEGPATTYNRRAGEIRGLLDQALRPWALWLAGELPPVPAPACPDTDSHEPWRECPTCDRLARAAAQVTVDRRTRAIHVLIAAPLAGVIEFLTAHLEEIRHHPDGAALARAVTDAVTTIRKVIDRPGRQRYGGACGAELAGGTLCSTGLYAEEGEAEFECRACGTRWSVDERQAWLRDVAVDELASAPVIAAALIGDDSDDPDRGEFRRLLKRIHQWARRGRLTARGELRGQPLYRVGDVQALLDSYTERGDRRGGRRERREGKAS